MKKTHLLFISIIVMIAMLAGCGRRAETSSSAELAEEAISEEVPKEAPEVIETPAPIEVIKDFPDEEEVVSSEDNTPADEEAPTAEENTEGKPDNDSLRTIVWLGDSLTQGSLGEDNDNLPNAPYVKLQSMIPTKVEGYGLYGYNTHDIFWVYKDEDHYDQTVDPNKIYIFWVGSNDWCPIDGENTNTAPVIAEIDSFLQSGGVKDYIVMGTTQRWRLGLDRAKIINADLAAHYGNHYMDVIDLIEKNGFSEDNTHLSQASYDAIAGAVCAKLKALGYI